MLLHKIQAGLAGPAEELVRADRSSDFDADLAAFVGGGSLNLHRVVDLGFLVVSPFLLDGLIHSARYIDSIYKALG